MSGRHIKSLPLTTQSRDWKFVAAADGHTADELMDVLRGTGFPYWVFSEERGDGGFHHYQGFMQCGRPVKLGQLIKRFKCAGYLGDDDQGVTHFQPRGKQSVQDAIAYCQKDDTHIAGPWTDGVPDLKASAGKRSDLIRLNDAIMSGMTYDEILRDPELTLVAASKMAWVKARCKIAYKDQIAKEEDRKIEVIYRWGTPGSGKTYSVMHGYPRDQIYRVTDYRAPFDSYSGQPVLFLDEFYGGSRGCEISWSQLQDILDVYPMEVHSRYANDSSARWTTVIISCNWPLEDQYPEIIGPMRASLLRRISRVEHWTRDQITTSDVVLADDGSYRLRESEIRENHR